MGIFSSKTRVIPTSDFTDIDSEFYKTDDFKVIHALIPRLSKRESVENIKKYLEKEDNDMSIQLKQNGFSDSEIKGVSTLFKNEIKNVDKFITRKSNRHLKPDGIKRKRSRSRSRTKSKSWR